MSRLLLEDSPRYVLRAMLTALLATACMGHALAAPVTIGFEGVVDPGDRIVAPAYAEQGYSLTFTATSPAVTGPYITGSDFLGVNGNGTSTYAFCTSPGTLSRCLNGMVTLGHDTVFSLLSLDLASYFPEGSGRIAGGAQDAVSGLDALGRLFLVGYLAGGGTVNATLDVGYDWTTKTLANFTNLTRVTLSGVDSNFIAIDNLVLASAGSTGNVVPEPMSLGLAGVALAALAASTRRRRNLLQPAARQSR